MVTTIQQLGHKFAYLAMHYPGDSVEELISYMKMPSININVAIWYAKANGLISEAEDHPSKPNQKQVLFLKEPDAWDFGETVNFLVDAMEYGFRELGKKEVDQEENFLGNWMTGYSPLDVEIAIWYGQHLNRIANYEVEDADNTYVFFTLPENRHHEWGRKQFKKEPVGIAEGDAPIVPGTEPGVQKEYPDTAPQTTTTTESTTTESTTKAAENTAGEEKDATNNGN